MRLLLIPLLSLSAYDLPAQSNSRHIEHQQLLWMGCFSTVNFNECWSLMSDLQERRFINPDAQHQLVMRTQLQRELTNGWAAALGLCRFLQSSNDPASGMDLVVPEWRPHAELSVSHSAGDWRIGHRYRTEARYFHETADGGLAPGYAFGNIRVRYRLACDIPLIKGKGGLPERLLLRLADELHLNFGGNIANNAFDQNRIMMGVQSALSRSIAVELGYLNLFQQRPSGMAYYARDIVRVAVHHRIDVATGKEGIAD